MQIWYQICEFFSIEMLQWDFMKNALLAVILMAVLTVCIIVVSRKISAVIAKGIAKPLKELSDRLKEFENGDIKALFAGESSDSVNIDAFNESIITVTATLGNSCIVETVLDFSELYDGFSFASGKRVGFDIVVSDNVNGGVVRYVWNDDTGAFFDDPDSLGTFVMGTASVVVSDDVEDTDEEDDNPGTNDSVILFYAMTCLCAVVLGAVVSYRMKAKK